MTQDDKSEERERDVAPRISLLYLVLGAVFLLAYFLLAERLGFFIDPDLAYVNSEIGRLPWAEFSQSYIRYFPTAQLGSMLWKLLLLLPGTFFLSLFLSSKLAESRGSVTRFSGDIEARFTVIALLVVGLAALVGFIHFVFHSTYVTDDENAYDLQAEILLRGMLYAPAPPVEDSFKNWFIISAGKYTGKYTLGHPLILAAGKALGSPYLLTVLLSLLSIMLTYRVGTMLYGSAMGVLGAALLVASPFFLFTSSTLLSHSTSFFALALFTYLFLTAYAKNKKALAFCAGFAAGYAFNVRSLTAIGFCAPFVFWAMARLLKDKKLVMPLAMLMGFLIPFALTLEYNRIITGRYTEFPFHYYNPTERFGFGKMLRDNMYEHTPARAFVNLAVSAARMNTWLFGFPASLMFIVLLPILKGVRASPRGSSEARADRPIKRPDAFLFSIIVCFAVAYLFYYSPGVSDTGPIYYFELLLPLVLLSGRGIALLHKVLTESAGVHSRWRAFTPVFVIVSIIFSLIAFYPEKAIHIMNLTEKVREPYERLKEAGVKNAVVFVESLPRAGWVFAYRHNAPRFDGDMVFAQHLTFEKDLEVVRAFPNRNYYALRYDSEAGRSVVMPVTKEMFEKALERQATSE
jgi:hypothetical protein